MPRNDTNITGDATDPRGFKISQQNANEPGATQPARALPNPIPWRGRILPVEPIKIDPHALSQPATHAPVHVGTYSTTNPLSILDIARIWREMGSGKAPLQPGASILDYSRFFKWASDNFGRIPTSGLPGFRVEQRHTARNSVRTNYR